MVVDSSEEGCECLRHLSPLHGNEWNLLGELLEVGVLETVSS